MDKIAVIMPLLQENQIANWQRMKLSKLAERIKRKTGLTVSENYLSSLKKQALLGRRVFSNLKSPQGKKKHAVLAFLKSPDFHPQLKNVEIKRLVKSKTGLDISPTMVGSVRTEYEMSTKQTNPETNNEVKPVPQENVPNLTLSIEELIAIKNFSLTVGGMERLALLAAKLAEYKL